MERSKRKPRYLKNLKLGAGEGEGRDWRRKRTKSRRRREKVESSEALTCYGGGEADQALWLIQHQGARGRHTALSQGCQ